MEEEPYNPYAPPRAEPDLAPRFVGAAGVLRREGETILIPAVGASFPPRCVMCNEPAPHRLRRKLWWHPPGYYALICIGWLIYAIVALIVRKSAEFEIGVCDRHAKRRRNGILLGWIAGPICLIAGIALADRSPVALGVLLVAFVAVVVAAALMVRLVSAARIKDGFAWIKVGKPFLDSIP